MFGVIIVALLLDARILNMMDLDGQVHPARRITHLFREIHHAELLGELVHDAVFPEIGRVDDSQLYAAHRVTDVNESASLPPLP